MARIMHAVPGNKTKAKRCSACGGEGGRKAAVYAGPLTPPNPPTNSVQNRTGKQIKFETESHEQSRTVHGKFSLFHLEGCDFRQVSCVISLQISGTSFSC